VRVAAVVAVSVLVAVSCARDGGRSSSSGSLSGQLVVFAAASLTDAFGDIAEAVESEQPALDVALDFGPSSRLATQIAEGAPADVFASADDTTMAVAVDAGAVRGEPEVFARNRLEIAVPAGNPGRVSSLADFADEDLLIGLCAEEVPCGHLGRDALDSAGVAPAVDTNEADVRSLLTKIEAGELDAGLVYRTDVLAAEGAVEGIELADGQDVETTYSIASLATGDAPGTAAALVDFVLSDPGRRILRRHGFLAP
jgi:molybdate transport system substrate-binding protein